MSHPSRKDDPPRFEMHEDFDLLIESPSGNWVSMDDYAKLRDIVYSFIQKDFNPSMNTEFHELIFKMLLEGK